MLCVLLDVGGLLGGGAPSVLGEIIFVEGCHGSRLVDALGSLSGIGLITPDGDGAIAAANLDKVVAMMRHRHELGQRGIPV